MKIISAPNSFAIDEFLSKNPGASGPEFLLSSSWAKILEKEGKEIRFLAVIRDLSDGKPKTLAGEFLALIMIIKQPLLKRYFYWYAPRGPIINRALNFKERIPILKFLFTAIYRLSAQALFLKIEPANEDLNFNAQDFQQKTFSGFLKTISAPDIQPRRTLVLDLKKSQDELLSSLHPKTRYNIRLAEKKGVKITRGGANDFEEFWRLMKLTGERDAFCLHDKNHYQNLLKTIVDGQEDLESEKNFIRLFFAEYEGRKIAAALVSSFASKATYLHGASDNEYRQLMAPQFLQWEIIKTVKSEGANLYDFYGVDALKWPGVTRFKQGFGGEERVYSGAYDLIFRPAMYNFYKLLKLLRKLIKLKYLKSRFSNYVRN